MRRAIGPVPMSSPVYIYIYIIIYTQAELSLILVVILESSIYDEGVLGTYAEFGSTSILPL